MHLSFNYILIHIGNSDFGQELIREFYSLKNQIILVGKCKKHLTNLKNQFPKIEFIVCDVKKEEDLNSLIARCSILYPSLDIVVHSNFNHELITSDNQPREIAEYMQDAEILSIHLFPIFSKKINTSIIFTKIEKKSLLGNKLTHDTKGMTHFLQLREKSSDASIQFLQINIPIDFLKLENNKVLKKATRKIKGFLKDCEKGRYHFLKEKNNRIIDWLTNLNS